MAFSSLPTKIVSAFPGTGKTYACENLNGIIELEGWRYHGSDFPDNYVSAIKDTTPNFQYVLISTNKEVLDKLEEEDLDFSIVYPSTQLKTEYLERYATRGSSIDFMEMLQDNWEKWINELEERENTLKIQLEQGEYLSSLL